MIIKPRIRGFIGAIVHPGGVLAAAVGLALLPPLSAQENRELVAKTAPISAQLAAWQQLLSTQRSFSLITVESGHVEPGFGRDDVPDFTATFKVYYKGDRFLYDVEFLGAKGLIQSRVENFDGVRYADLSRRGEGTYEASSRPYLYDIVMCRGHFFFNPFLFLQSPLRKDALAQLSYNQLTNKDDWTQAFATLAADSAIEEVTLDHEPCLKVSRFANHPDPASDQPCVYDVYFAKKLHWYPVKWERHFAAGAGDLVASYTVEELGSIKTESGEEIPYPKKSLVKNYMNGKLRDTEHCEVTAIQFAAVSDGDLAIDPAAARFFRDLDGNGKLQERK